MQNISNAGFTTTLSIPKKILSNDHQNNISFKKIKFTMTGDMDSFQ